MKILFKKYALYVLAIILWGIYFIVYSDKLNDGSSPVLVSFIVWILMIIALIWRFYESSKKQKL
jgi:hypothetical protein|nr:hypothetical protein [uncultured Emticicia sp.]